ncbi:hypothetical protein GEMRC1_002693 [Eukaryota sp. GEM-RC1]
MCREIDIAEKSLNYLYPPLVKMNLTSKYGDIRATSSSKRFRSVEEARNFFRNKSDCRSVILHSIAARIFDGEILTLSDIKGLLRMPTTATEDEVISSITEDLPVYAYKEPGLKEFLILPIDVCELLHVVCRQRKLASTTYDSTPKSKRGSYSCSICGKLGHTKAKCPIRFQPNVPQNAMYGSSQPQYVSSMTSAPVYHGNMNHFDSMYYSGSQYR